MLRAGNGLLEGMLDLVPAARVAHIGLYRDHDTLEAVDYYFKVPADAAEGEDDSVKVVGPLRVAIPLFNIFLNEADEQSRRLGTEIAEWTLEPHRPMGDSAVALAHSLAGNSGTVGFADLSMLARALEHALMRSRAVGHASDGEAQLFSDAAAGAAHLDAIPAHVMRVTPSDPREVSAFPAPTRATRAQPAPTRGTWPSRTTTTCRPSR